MKLPGRLLLTLFLAFGVSVAALAQLAELRQSTPQERAEIQTRWMHSNLALDAKATAAVADINLKYAQELQDKIGSGSPGIGDLLSFRKKAAEKDAELQAIFTPAQYQLYEERKSELRELVKKQLAQKYAPQD